MPSTREQVRQILQRRQYLNRPWVTATQVSNAFGFDYQEPFVAAALKSLVDEGVATRRPYQGSGRARWEYALRNGA